MTLPYPIAASQTDFKSPIDDQLMDAIRLDLNDLDSRISSIGNYAYQFKLNGPIGSVRLPYRRIDGVLVAEARTFSTIKLFMENPGNSGSLEIDIRKYKTPNTAITALARQYSASINSIARAGSALNTQSITKATAQINTQSITQFKTSINISSIILLGNNLVRYNLASQPDSHWIVGDSVTTASATTGANNGAWTIVRVNDDGGNNIVVVNTAGVAQTGSAGTMRLNAWAYNFTNPVDSMFVAGEKALFASHTSAVNDGSLTMYAVNSGGNNIIVKSATGATQGGVAGTADALRWKYNLSSAATSDYAAGESALFASHTSSVNDGTLPVMAVNSGGNNLVVYNTAGALQGGVAGTINTYRWIYALSSSPTSSFSVAQTFVSLNATSAFNNGTFTVKEVSRGGTDNLVAYNILGVAQGGAVGTLVHSRMLVSFASDQSSIYSTASRVGLTNLATSSNEAEYTVLEVNRGGGSNFNVVVDMPSGFEQASPCGRVNLESRSLFSARPVLTNATRYTNSTNRELQYTTTATFGAEATVAANSILALEILSVPSGAFPSDVVVQLN